ncbi:MAG: hypothetical protein RR975_11995, partial [Clostridia bacterium]
MEGQQQMNDFFKWLSSHVPATQYTKLCSVYSYLDEFCMSKQLIKCCLMDCDDISTVRKARTALVSNKIYRFFNQGKTDNMVLLLQRYEDYLRRLQSGMLQPAKDITKNDAENIATPINAPQVETEEADTSVEIADASSIDLCSQQSPIERFKEMLTANGSGPATVQNAVLALEWIENLVEKNQSISTELTITKDYKEAMRTYSELLLCSEYSARNRACDGLLTETLTRYVNMLRAEQQQNNEKPHKASMVQDTEPVLQEKNAETSINVLLPCKNNLSSQNDVVELIKQSNLKYIDKRSQGGRLCV